MQENSANVYTVGIIGGGKVGEQLLQMFMQSQLVKVAYVVDTNIQAPALAIARKAKIATFNEIDRALASINVDFVFEVTGSRKVADLLQQKLADAAMKLVTHDMAYVILKVMEENEHRVTQSVSEEILGIKHQITNSLEGVGRQVDNLEQITDDMRMLALNARIEAARVGEQGKGFAIVAQKMADSVDSVRGISQEIEKVNADIKEVSNRIEASLERLK